MLRKKIILVLFFISLCLPLLVFPQQKKVDIQRIDITHLPEIQCYFTVTDETGNSLLGFTEDEIQITVDGAAQNLSRLTSAIEGGEYLAVALLFDRSGSMKSAFDNLKKAALDFVQRLSLEDVISIISFDDTVRIDSPFTKERELTVNAIEGISMGNNTALYDAVHEALTLLDKIETPRQAVIIFSDGVDTRSTFSRIQILQEAKDAETPLFFIGLGDKINEDNLISLSSETGGRYFRAGTPEELVLLYQTIAEQLKNQYLAVFSSTFGQDERWHNLEITLKEPSGMESRGGKKYIASRGPGVSRELIADFERKSEQTNILLLVGIGAFLGLLVGIIILLLIRLARPEVSFSAGLVILIFLSTMIIGAIVSFLIGTVLKT
jgi:VWFA-related protein